MLHGINLKRSNANGVLGSSLRWPYREGDLVRLTETCGLLPSGNYRVVGVLGDFLFLGDNMYRTALGLMYAPYVTTQPDRSAPLVSTEEQMRFGEGVIEALESSERAKNPRAKK